MAGYYVLSKNAKKEYWFVLKADNHQTILTSEMYAARSGAENGIASVRANCGDDGNYARLRSRNNDYYFVLKAQNGQVIGVSEMYATSQGCENGIASVKVNGPTRTVEDKTGD